jgi:anti-anti-sigma factor
MADLSLEVRSDGPARVVIAVAGEVDMATAPQLAECLHQHRDVDVIVDLSGVTFLDSSGISALVVAYKGLHDAGHTLTTTGEQDNVRMVIETSGLLRTFHGGDSPGR